MPLAAVERVEEVRLVDLRQPGRVGEFQAVLAGGRHLVGHADRWPRSLRRVVRARRPAGRRACSRNRRPGSLGIGEGRGGQDELGPLRPAWAASTQSGSPYRPMPARSIGWKPSFRAGRIGPAGGNRASPHRRTADRPGASAGPGRWWPATRRSRGRRTAARPGRWSSRRCSRRW